MPAALELHEQPDDHVLDDPNIILNFNGRKSDCHMISDAHLHTLD